MMPKGSRLPITMTLTADSRDAGVENLPLPAAGIYTIHLSTFDLLQGGGVEVQLITSAPPMSAIKAAKRFWM